MISFLDIYRHTYGSSVAVLALLETCAGGSSASEFARKSGVTEGAVSSLIERSARQGLIQRRASSVDRRCKILVLTPKGREMLRTYQEKFTQL